MKQWWVYIIETQSGNFYTGITTDLERRWQEHCHLKRGAKYLKAHPPKTMRYCASQPDRSSASKEEHRIKKLSRDNKLSLVNSNSNQLDCCFTTSRQNSSA